MEIGTEPISLYRARQFFRALRARVECEELEILDRHLNAAQKELFFRMPLQDQRHSLNVFHTLERAGYQDADLLQAALLHDVGKTSGRGRIKLGHRVLVVLLKAFCPWLLTRLAGVRREDWREPFYLHVNHPRLGAEMARTADGSPQVVEYIRLHHEPGLEGFARVLQNADGTS
ncbi:MAG: HDOD domain-containing protein [Chloroflexi bacterium]|nr:HDOD domain-containing protein [Chloroflexota bacterium]